METSIWWLIELVWRMATGIELSGVIIERSKSRLWFLADQKLCGRGGNLGGMLMGRGVFSTWNGVSTSLVVHFI